MSLYQKLAFLYGDIMNVLHSMEADRNFRRERKRDRTGDKIRVGFLCQYIPAWGKLEPVYRRMKESEEFEVFLLCVPMGIHKQRLDDPSDLSNDTYEYYKQAGYEEAVNALTGENQWLDLKSLELDYLFFTRPYNTYMPPEYSSHVVSKYTRICVLLYAFTLTEETYRSTLNQDFFCNVYLYFAENTYAMEKNIRHFRRRHKKGLQKSVCYGMAALEEILCAKDRPAPSWDFSKQEFRVLWTPRWTTDKSLGGSNFFVYRQALLDYAGDHREMDFLYRPHPLMFDNFLKTGEMTEEEIGAYKHEIAELPNVSLDQEKEYGATIWNSSVLVSDISSFMPEYFITGKPVVYCPADSNLTLAGNSIELIEGCYIAHDKEELFGILEQLQRGEDPLRKKREELIPKLFGEDIPGIPARIVEELIRDHGNSR